MDLENDFISPINYMTMLTTTSLAQLFIHEHGLENDFISPIIYTWPWLT